MIFYVTGPVSLLDLKAPTLPLHPASIKHIHSLQLSSDVFTFHRFRIYDAPMSEGRRQAEILSHIDFAVPDPSGPLGRRDNLLHVRVPSLRMVL
jgi:hypothetical protein